MDTDRFIQIAKALSDATRFAMLDAIRAKGELTCSQVCEMFHTSQPTISHHIKTLKEAGIIRVRRDGPFHVLTLEAGALRDFAGKIAVPAPARRRNRSRPKAGRARSA